MLIYFSDFFEVDPDILEKYGAFDISLVNDLPLFIDPFLLFGSSKQEYQDLHDGIIRYLQFLRDVAVSDSISDGLLFRWFTFKEVKENWLGYSTVGNNGSGLGKDFAYSLYQNLRNEFISFGQEQITKGSHLEKLCLIDNGVGRDNISDFTVNLIKEYLLNYTQNFASEFIDKSYCQLFSIDKVRFDYDKNIWKTDIFYLPTIDGKNYVILTPKDMLTRHETWISRCELQKGYYEIPPSIPDEQLRGQIDYHFRSQLSKKSKNKDKEFAWFNTIQRFPAIIDYYIRNKEDNGEEAANVSNEYVAETEQQFITQVKTFVEQILSNTDFYKIHGDTLDEARERVFYLKQVIEHNDGYRLFDKGDEPIHRESDLQILYRLTWYATPSDVNREVNNGRGPVDFKVSRGSRDKSLVEFKLAKNSKLKQNLENQVKVYETANQTNKSLKVIVFFTEDEEKRVKSILRELEIDNDPDIILIDARADNKPSASNVK
ncbi:MAG: hypothetical protein WCO98_05265 [bacterium]